MRRLLLTTALLCIGAPVGAEPLMDRAQYIDYSAQQHCINQQYWDQPAKQEEELLALEKKLGISEEDYTALDDLAISYGADAEVQEAIEARAREICPPSL